MNGYFRIFRLAYCIICAMPLVGCYSASIPKTRLPYDTFKAMTEVSKLHRGMTRAEVGKTIKILKTSPEANTSGIIDIMAYLSEDIWIPLEYIQANDRPGDVLNVAPKAIYIDIKDAHGKNRQRLEISIPPPNGAINGRQ